MCHINKFALQQSTDNGETWKQVGDAFNSKMSADGALGAIKARSKSGQTFRVVPFTPRTKRPHISVILGAVAAKMWLEGVDPYVIDKHLTKQFRKFTKARKAQQKQIAAAKQYKAAA